MAEIFGWFLEGHPLLTNRSMWRNFPMIRSKRWVKDNMVLLGDAKATAHFSIGSGTKLAMEDAIALADAMAARADGRRRRLQTYEHGRREEVEKTQHAADVSLVWFEHVDRFWDFDPVQFAFGVMTRAKAITYDNLTLRAPDFVGEVDKAFAQAGSRQAALTSTSTSRWRRCSSRCRLREMEWPIARWCRRCACIRRRKACPAISIWCITARARSAAPG